MPDLPVPFPPVRALFLISRSRMTFKKSLAFVSAAFYSDTRAPPGITQLDEARITYGTRNGEPWLHCHGFWTEADGTKSGGHVLPDLALIAQPIATQAWLTTNAAFTARHDPETNFTLFAPEPTTGQGDHLAIRLRPNQDISAALEQLCADHNIARATIRGGVASIIGAAFDDGRTAEPFATEIFIRSGEVTPHASRIDIALVNYLGEMYEGRLLRGANPVLMTAELLLHQEA